VTSPASIASYKDLIAWQRALDLVDLVYESSKEWPVTELYGLTSQVRRAVVSVAANIAEGHGRNGRREVIHHLGIARGSLCEVETMVIIGARQRFLSDVDQQSVLACSQEVGKLLNGLIRSLSQTPEHH
jgi:four helix bundle protein